MKGIKLVALWGGMLVVGLVFGLVVGGFGIEDEGEVAGLADEAVEALPVTPTPEVQEINIRVVGDVMLGRSVNAKSVRQDDYVWPFTETAGWLKEADLTLGNLETPVVEDCPVTDEGMIFCADPKMIEGLQLAGFDGMSLANNHSQNYGDEGFYETVEQLETRGIQGIQLGEVWVSEVDGVKVGVMSFDDVTVVMDPILVERDIMLAKEGVDVLVGLVHWGVEYVSEPTERQIEMGRMMVDAGMDVVVGTHPHWTQPIEEYEDGVIFYSLGNFVFDQMWSDETRQGEVVLLKLKTQNSKLKDIEYELKRVKIYDFGQPRFEE